MGAKYDRAAFEAIERKVLAAMGTPDSHLLGASTTRKTAKQGITHFYFDLALRQYCLANGTRLKDIGEPALTYYKGRRLHWGLALHGPPSHKVAIRAKGSIAKNVTHELSMGLKLNQQFGNKKPSVVIAHTI